MTRNSSVRAITTRYKGYSFRSRLEARWAVFFDHLGIRWEYEPEGFELGNGLRYLPDFWLPDWKLWVEVKPGPPDDMAKEKAWRLALHTDAPLFMSNGMPDAIGTFFCIYRQQGGEIGLWDFPARAPWHEKTIYTQGDTDDLEFGFEVYQMDDLDKGLYAEAEQALYAARSARFEFGQGGAA